MAQPRTAPDLLREARELARDVDDEDLRLAVEAILLANRAVVVAVEHLEETVLRRT